MGASVRVINCGWERYSNRAASADFRRRKSLTMQPGRLCLERRQCGHNGPSATQIFIECDLTASSWYAMKTYVMKLARVVSPINMLDIYRDPMTLRMVDKHNNESSIPEISCWTCFFFK